MHGPSLPDREPDQEVDIEWTDRARQMGARLRQARLRVGLTQEQVGLRAGISRNHIHLLETGRSSPTLEGNPRIRMIYKLAAALNVPPVELLPADAGVVPATLSSTERKQRSP